MAYYIPMTKQDEAIEVIDEVNENDVLFHISLVFHRKDLCEARVKPEMSSYFQMKCTDKIYPQ